METHQLGNGLGGEQGHANWMYSQATSGARSNGNALRVSACDIHRVAISCGDWLERSNPDQSRWTDLDRYMYDALSGHNSSTPCVPASALSVKEVPGACSPNTELRTKTKIQKQIQKKFSKVVGGRSKRFTLISFMRATEKKSSVAK